MWFGLFLLLFGLGLVLCFVLFSPLSTFRFQGFPRKQVSNATLHLGTSLKLLERLAFLSHGKKFTSWVIPLSPVPLPSP